MSFAAEKVVWDGETTREGFWITFPNGYKVSVQFGTFNYCARYHPDYLGHDDIDCPDAEVAVMHKGRFVGGWPGQAEGDQVGAHLGPLEVLAVLNWAAAQEGEK